MLCMIHKRYKIDSEVYMRYGIILSIYRIFGIASFLVALNIFLREEMEQSISGCNEFSFLLPFCVMVYDYQLKFIKARKERFKIIKIIIVTFYWVIMILALCFINADEAYIEYKN